MPMPLKQALEKRCQSCGMRLERKRFPNGALESLLHFGRRKFCSEACFANSLRKERSDGKWTSAHTMARKRVPTGPCERCGAPDARDVHHRNRDHQDNRRENLERICRSCHNKEHRQPRSCVICGKPHSGRGYCEMHYQRWRKHGDPMKVTVKPKSMCKVCGKPSQARALCGKHYMQVKRGQLRFED